MKKLLRGLLVASLLMFSNLAYAQSLSIPASWPSTTIDPGISTGQYWTAPSFSGSAMATPSVGTSGNVPTSTPTSPTAAGTVHSMFVSLSPGVSGATGATVTVALIDTSIWSPTGYLCSCAGEIFVRVPTGASSAVGFPAPAGFQLTPGDNYVILITSDNGVTWTGSGTVTIQ